MQKRIFAVVTVLLGLLLGLGVLMATFLPDAVPTFAGNHKHHQQHHTQTQTQTQTVTNTVTTTVTSGPPAPVCFVTPNPVPLAVGASFPTSTGVNTTASNPGDGQFELLCSGLNPSLIYKVVFSLPCEFVEPYVHSTQLGNFQSEGTLEPIVPDILGKLQITFIVQKCEPGTGTIDIASTNNLGIEVARVVPTLNVGLVVN
jgi:hypothetical protein